MRRTRILALLTLAIPLTSAAQTQEQKDLFAWFDTLGYTKILTLPFTQFDVHVQGGTGPPMTQAGFLLSKPATKIVLFQPNLWTRVFYKDHGLWPREPLKDADFEAYARQSIKDAVDARRSPNVAYRYEEIAGLFVLARAAAVRGNKDLSLQLYNEAEAYNPKLPDAKSFAQDLKDEIAIEAYDACCIDFGSEELRRPDLGQHFQAFLNHFPNSQEAPFAKERIRVLTQMIEEDRQPAAPIKNPNKKQKIAEDIDALKDYRGETGYWPYGLGIPWEPSDKTYDPARDLIDKGIDAVPQLLDALKDERYAPACMATSYWQGAHTPVDSVFTIGDVALEILKRIAKGMTDQGVLEQGQRPEMEKEIRTWWASVQAIGEKETLIEGMMKDDQDSYPQAQLLVTRFPNEAAQPIAQLLAKDPYPDQRGRLIDLLQPLGTDASKAVLRDMMIHGKTMQDRFGAAQDLPVSDPSGPVKAMIHEWNTARLGRADSFDPNPVDRVAQYLFGSNTADAIEALEKRIREASIEVRGEVVQYDVMDRSKCILQIENLLAEELTDNDVLNEEGYEGDSHFENLRLSDFAGRELAHIWPQKGYHFEYCASAEDYEKQRVQNLNVYRKEHGLDPLPIEG